MKKDNIKNETKIKEVSHIVRPLITEKASMQSNDNAYTFVVSSDATKLSLLAEIKSKHKVTPIKINITNLPSKRVFVKGRSGVKSGIKKAIVFLKKGDSLKLA